MVGIGIGEKHAVASIRELCTSKGLQLFFWTMIDDEGKIPFQKDTYREAYFYLLQVGVDGVLTEFP